MYRKSRQTIRIEAKRKRCAAMREAKERKRLAQADAAGRRVGLAGLLPVGLIPIPPMILQEANRRAMEHGDLTFGDGIIIGLALCATWGLCAVAIWIKRAIVRRFHKANAPDRARLQPSPEAGGSAVCDCGNQIEPGADACRECLLSFDTQNNAGRGGGTPYPARGVGQEVER